MRIQNLNSIFTTFIVIPNLWCPFIVEFHNFLCLFYRSFLSPWRFMFQVYRFDQCKRPCKIKDRYRFIPISSGYVQECSGYVNWVGSMTRGYDQNRIFIVFREKTVSLFLTEELWRFEVKSKCTKSKEIRFRALTWVRRFNWILVSMCGASKFVQ